MVSVQELAINRHHFLCVTLHLPGLTTRLIYCTHGILFDDCWNLEAIRLRCRVPVCIGKGRSLEALLENPIIERSRQAQKKGIVLGASGRQALLRMVDES